PWVTLALSEHSESDVYLTFDDGPHPSVTPEILALLNQFGARATFFPTGTDAAAYPLLTDAIRAEGHTVHLHSWSHNRNVCRSLKILKEELTQCRSISESRIYRPPYGRFTIRQWLWLRKNRYRIILWNVSTRDYNPASVSEKCIGRFLQRIKPGDIILLHNQLNFKEKSLFLTHRILQYLTEKNISFGKIS
ncbi:MAG TPA: polysaccharide deacetylase family protein, partial [Bacteroidales bacterium]|nr:polysaccharide deacetylase family protein [Bacteroidales bacterium]